MFFIFGLALDDTVHFMHNFQINLDIHKDIKITMKKTLNSTRMDTLLTIIILSVDFLIFTFLPTTNLIYFGLILGLTIIILFH